ncbi:MAG TPA: ABC transporter ATP-binding protein [Clostridiales bacterium]|nr:ABC transporter ATP-binding protein [Clostridiales bacterium]
MDAILEVKNLRKSFQDFALKDICFSLPKGFIMGFIGPNGAGKSTTIKLILNLLKKDGGEIKIFGLDHIRHENEIKNRIGFVFDENYFYEDLTILEMKKFVSAVYKNWDENLFTKYLKEFQLPPKKKIKELSKGMKMKFSLAVALSHQAELLIMDEPTSGLDHKARHELLDILSYLMQDENKGVLFSTHITSDLEKIADYITFIQNGEIILSTTKDEIIDNHAVIKGDKNLLNQENRKYFIGLRENQFGFEGLIRNKDKLNRDFANQVLIEKPSLEDIMIYYMRGEKNA